MREVVIVDGVRSAFTNFGGGLRTLASVDIASRVVDGLLKRTGILERGTVDGLIAGCALGDSSSLSSFRTRLRALLWVVIYVGSSERM